MPLDDLSWGRYAGSLSIAQSVIGIALLQLHFFDPSGVRTHSQVRLEQEAGANPARDRRCKRGGLGTKGHFERDARGKASPVRLTREPENGPMGLPC